VSNRNLNTVVSKGFRMAVGTHLACLCVLFFGMKNTLLGLWHSVAAVILTALVGSIVVLFVIDMVTREDESRRLSKLIDGVIAIGWLAVVVPLFLNSWHSGIW
jgi:hypothetical protein